MQKTTVIKRADIKKEWYLIDAKDMNLGRLAVQAASLLMGKKKLTYTPNMDSGDNVIIINAKHIRISPKKVETKMYYKHSGYMGGLKSVPFNKMLEKSPSVVIKHAVKGMIPKNKIADRMLANLKVYNDENYKEVAQKPIKL